MTKLMKMNHFQTLDEDEKENYLQIDLKIESSNQNQNKRSNSHISMKFSNRMHINT